jgi:hypothetical protein
MRGDGQNQLKVSAPHPRTETYRFILLLATLISLDSPFKAVTFSNCSLKLKKIGLSLSLIWQEKLPANRKKGDHQLHLRIYHAFLFHFLKHSDFIKLY